MKLSRREKYSVYTVSIALFLFVLIQFFVFPFLDKKERLARMIRIKTSALEEMKMLRSDYEAITQKASLSKRRFSKRQKGFTLFSFLDKLARETGLKDSITYMKPSTITQKNSPV